MDQGDLSKILSWLENHVESDLILDSAVRINQAAAWIFKIYIAAGPESLLNYFQKVSLLGKKKVYYSRRSESILLVSL